MTAEEIKAAILQLPDEEIGPLARWLQGYYDGEVWDRQMAADIARLGEAEWERRLINNMETAPQRRKAALRLMNSLHDVDETARHQHLRLLKLLLGEAPE